MSIVITIPDEHPHYLELSKSLEPRASDFAGFVSIEQHMDGTWSARFARIALMLNWSRCKPYAVRIEIVKS